LKSTRIYDKNIKQKHISLVFESNISFFLILIFTDSPERNAQKFKKDMKKRISIHAKESGDSQFLRDLLQRRIRVKKK